MLSNGVFIVIILLRLPGWYTAEAVIIPIVDLAQKTDRPSLALSLTNAIKYQTFHGYAIGLLKSRSLQTKVASRHFLIDVYNVTNAELAVEKLRKRIEIEPTEQNCIAIRASDYSRQRAAAIANTFVEEFADFNARFEKIHYEILDTASPPEQSEMSISQRNVLLIATAIHLLFLIVCVVRGEYRSRFGSYHFAGPHFSSDGRNIRESLNSASFNNKNEEIEK